MMFVPGGLFHCSNQIDLLVKLRSKDIPKSGMLCVGFHQMGVNRVWFIYPLVMTNVAMENGPFIDGVPMFTY